VTDPFPEPITVGIQGKAGSVDSFTSKRRNLATSSHFFTFTTAVGGAATISLNIVASARQTTRAPTIWTFTSTTGTAGRWKNRTGPSMDSLN
jgi:hypothetical protein